MGGYKTGVVLPVEEQLALLITEIEKLSEYFPQLRLMGYSKKLRDAASQLMLSSEAQLLSLKDGHIHSDWLVLAQVVENVNEKIAASSVLELPSGSLDRAICVPQACPSGVTQEQVDDILIAAAAAEIAVAIAQGVASVIPQEVLGVPNPAYIAAALVAAALDVAAKTLALTAAVMQKEVNKANACEEEAFRQVVYSMCDTINQIKSSLDSLHAKVDLLDKKINILLELTVKLTELTEELLLREIEEDLAECKKLTSLYLPQAVGGGLDTVQNMIQTLLNSSISAGMDTGAAESYVKQGMIAALDKNYCKALVWYSLAYQQLTAAACCEDFPPCECVR